MLYAATAAISHCYSLPRELQVLSIIERQQTKAAGGAEAEMEAEAEEGAAVPEEEIESIERAALLNRAACSLELGMHQAALDDCVRVLRDEPANPKALFRRGRSLLKLGRLQEAQKALKGASKLLPTNKAIRAELREVVRSC